MSIKKMLQIMEEEGWNIEDIDQTNYDEVKEAYKAFCDEMSDDSLLFPNGRDYDAEDEDGPF